MFKNEYQGGPFFEIFSAQGKDPVSKWKLTGGASSIQKVFDKDVKSYVYTLEGGSTTTKMQIPKDAKQSLFLVQRYLVFQIYIPLGQDFSVELGITDLANNKRRILLSTCQREIAATPLHAKIPLTILRKKVWLHLVLDLLSLVGENFRGQTFRALESLTLSANCRIRKVFTMKAQPPDTTDDDELYSCDPVTDVEIDSIPRALQLSREVEQCTQVLTMTKIRQAEWKIRGDSSRPTSSTETPDRLNASRRVSDDRPTHIAFGSRVAIPSTAQSRKGSAGPREGSGSASGRSNRSSHSRTKVDDPTPTSCPTGRDTGPRVDKLVIHHRREWSDPGSAVEDLNTSVNKKGSLKGCNTWGAEDMREEREESEEKTGRQEKPEMLRPHPPPRENSSDNLKRRQIRIRNTSGGQYTRSQSTRDPPPAEPLEDVQPPKEDPADAPPQTDVHDEELGESGPDVDGDADSERDDHEDEQYSPDEKDKMFTFSSRPHFASWKAGSDSLDPSDNKARHDGINVQRKAALANSDVFDQLRSRIIQIRERHEMRRSQWKSSDRSARLAHPEDDFYASSSSEEEPVLDLHQKILRSPSPRTGHTPVQSPHSSHSSQQLRLQQSVDQQTRSSVTSQDYDENERTSSGNTLSSNGFLPTPVPSVEVSPTFSKTVSQRVGSRSRNSSQSRLSVKVSKLKELTKEDVETRLSTTQEYDWRNYQSPNSSMGESFEAAMLASLKRQQEEEMYEDTSGTGSHDTSFERLNYDNAGLSSSDDDASISTWRAPCDTIYEDSHTSGTGSHNTSFQRLNYDHAGLSSSDDDASISTWRAPVPAMLANHYQDEMRLPSSRRDPLMQSNPRDWTMVFSPPIVLPSEHKPLEHRDLSPRKPPGTNQDISPGSGPSSLISTEHEQQLEEELDLLYDPCLNCYFDPKSCKYYELA
ncbi:C3orf67 [Branchiostoma lanceolatum]|uniref:C3orf67 protein n=1 Tax=Branchiostoma lanceolatum TaxID=7740 RepID=A0A8J9ZWG2_BRALA|nr:C3orf67 [Branchiostoma lanceolatum]